MPGPLGGIFLTHTVDLCTAPHVKTGTLRDAKALYQSDCKRKFFKCKSSGKSIWRSE